MCVVSAEVFYKNPQEYIKRSEVEPVTIVTDKVSYSILPKIPNAHTLAAMQETEDMITGKRPLQTFEMDDLDKWLEEVDE